MPLQVHGPAAAAAEALCQTEDLGEGPPQQRGGVIVDQVLGVINGVEVSQ